MADTHGSATDALSDLEFAEKTVMFLSFCGRSKTYDDDYRNDFHYWFKIFLDKKFIKNKQVDITYDKRYHGYTTPDYYSIDTTHVLPHSWYDNDNMPLTTSSHFYYNDKYNAYVLCFISNTWILKLFFEKHDDLLIPSTNYSPEFKRDDKNPSPCVVRALSLKYDISHDQIFPKSFASRIAPPHGYFSDNSINEYHEHINRHSLMLKLLKAEQRLALAQVDNHKTFTSYDPIQRIAGFLVSKLFQPQTFIDKKIMIRMLIEEEEEKKERISSIARKNVKNYENMKIRRLDENPKYKRRLCSFWYDKKCTRGDECEWAHGINDLLGVDISKLSPSPSYKTRMCRKYELGIYCQFGVRCKFAHGSSDMRTLCEPC